MTPEQIAQMRALYGLDGTILSQFWIWLKAILGGDFGTSISLRRSVLEMLEARGFRNLRAWTHGVDTDLFPFHPEPGSFPGLENAARPLALFVGRVSYEKNISAFLDMDFPGTKVVCGVGPVEAALKQKYPHVHWVGLLPRPELARLYAAADVFVFPSRADTFGLVMV